jgi:uncharacterized membrane protein
MTALYIGLLLFGGSHLFSVLFPAVRNRLQAWTGENVYKGLYSIFALVGVVLVSLGYWQTRFDGSVLYVPYGGARHVTMLLVLAGFILISAFHGKGYLKKWVQNPFSVGVALWSTGHLIANGKTAVVLIYAMLLIISLLDIAANLARGERPLHEPQLRSDVIAVVVGLIIYAIFLLLFHPYVLGVPVLR